MLDAGYSMFVFIRDNHRFCVLSPAINRVAVPNGGPLSRISVFFVIIGGFMLRLTKLLLKAVIVLFCGKSSIFQFIRALLSMRGFYTHQSLKEPPFVTVPNFQLSDYSEVDMVYL